jgi:hypothetical protein
MLVNNIIVSSILSCKEKDNMSTLKQSLLLIESEVHLNLEPKPLKQETVKIRLECPRCCWIFETSPPDRKHPNFTYNKQEANNTVSSIIEEPRICRNPKCKKHFTLYWYNKANP